MAHVYADLNALNEYQKEIVQTLSFLEEQAGCKNDLIEDTRVKINAAIDRAYSIESAAYSSLQVAEEALSEAENRTQRYNSNLAEGQEPMTTPDFYYNCVDEREQDLAFATASREHAQDTLQRFEMYVHQYKRQQFEGIEHYKKLLKKSGDFFEAYIKLLIEAKKCTNVSEGTSNAGNNNSNESKDPLAMIKSVGQQWADSLTKEQYAAIRAYTGSAYININATLRGLSPSFQDGNRERAVLIHQALAACSIPQDCTVYRGASSVVLGALQNMPDDQIVGSFFCDNGFMSTSLNRDDSFGGDVKLVISVPVGSKGVYVGSVSQLGHSESEVLFDMGSVMRITRVERDKNGQRIIYAQMM